MRIEIAVMLGAIAVALTIYSLADRIVLWLYPMLY